MTIGLKSPVALLDLTTRNSRDCTVVKQKGNIVCSRAPLISIAYSVSFRLGSIQKNKANQKDTTTQTQRDEGIQKLDHLRNHGWLARRIEINGRLMAYIPQTTVGSAFILLRVSATSDGSMASTATLSSLFSIDRVPMHSMSLGLWQHLSSPNIPEANLDTNPNAVARAPFTPEFSISIKLPSVSILISVALCAPSVLTDELDSRGTLFSKLSQLQSIEESASLSMDSLLQCDSSESQSAPVWADSEASSFVESLRSNFVNPCSKRFEDDGGGEGRRHQSPNCQFACAKHDISFKFLGLCS
nr:hypothetical protein Iba_chr04eCG1080 [Ipomoea batatas]